MKHTIAILSICIFAFFGTSCGGTYKTNVSPTADVRNLAGKIEETGHTIFTTVVKQNKLTPELVSDQVLVDVSLAVNKLGHIGLTLNKALDAYLAAKSAGGDLTTQRDVVMQILDTINDAMADVGKALPPGRLQTIDTLANAVLGFVIQIKGVL